MKSFLRLLAFLAVLVAVPATATVTSSQNKVIISGNNVQTSFPFSFVGVSASDISVIFTNASGVSTTLTQGPGSTQYQVTLTAVAPGQLWGIGGTVTYNPGGTPIATGTTLTIVRTVPLTQSTSLQNQASFGQYAAATEKALDQVDMQVQQIAEAQNRVLSAPIVDPSSINLTLPPAAQRANTGLAFDGSGNVIAGTLPATGIISSAMAPVVSAATLAAGRTAFGLGTMALENIGGTCGGGTIQDDGSGNARVVFQTVADVTNQTVTCAFHGTQRAATGTLIYTLPQANTLFNGFGFWVYALTGSITFSPNAADNFQGLGSGASMIVPAGSAVYVTTNAASSGIWYADISITQLVPLSSTWYSNSLSAPPICGAVGLKITNGGTPNTTIALSADQILMQDSAGRTVNRNSVSLTGISIASGLVTSTANGMDGESPSTSNWLYVWAIDNGSGIAGLVSSASGNGLTPTMPTGYTYKCRLGAMRVDGSGNLLRTLQLGSESQYVVQAAGNLPVITTTPGSYWTSQATGSFVPPVATKINVSLEVTITQASGAAANVTAGVASNANYGNPEATGRPPCSFAWINIVTAADNFGFGNSSAQVCSLLLESTNIFTGLANASSQTTVVTLSALGWKDKVNAN